MSHISRAKAQSLIITLRYAIIRDTRVLFKWIAMLLVLSVITIFAIKNQLTNIPIGYVAVENTGEELALKGLKESPFPSMTLDQEKTKIIELTSECMNSLFSTDTQNYLTDFQESSSCFSSNTYHLFSKQLIDSGFISLLQSGEIWHGKADVTKTSLERFTQKGRLTWLINMPFHLTRYTREEPKEVDILLRIRVSRMNSLEYKHAIALTQVVIKNV